MSSRIEAGPSWRSRVSRASALAVVAALLWATPVAAPADPNAVKKARAEVDRLNTEAAAIDQDYAAVQDKLAKARKKLRERTADVAAQERKVAKMRLAASRIALAHYQGRDVDPGTALFFSGDPATFMNRYATVEQVTSNQNSSLQDFQAEQANLVEMKHDAEARQAAIAADEKNLAKLQKKSQAKVDEAKAVLAKLTAEERKRLAEQERKEAAEARRRAEGGQSRDDKASRSAERDTGSTGSGNAADALAYARAQIGKSYVMGGTGPSVFDCSGLTMMAWRHAGVSIPRTSQAQFSAGRAVSRSELQPGDLVFYYSSSPSHVGLYVGNGMILHAAHPGKPIGYDRLDSMPFVGARRPG